MKRSSTLLALTIAALTLACAADPGTRPQDMSAAAHEATAAHEDQSAQNHQSQHDPDARTESTRCAGKGGCWTSSRNPTAQHAEDAKQHRELSQKHRAAAAALIEAEARACAGIAEEDRDTSPFYHREDVESVSKLTEDVRFSKSTTRRDVGATVVFRAIPGMTAEWLQRLVDCHVARAAAVGHDMPEMSYCPLALRGITAKVTSTGTGFAVNVSSEDPKTIHELQKRVGLAAE
jgi:hypothetical protein